MLIICVFSALDSTRLSKLDFYGNFKGSALIWVSYLFPHYKKHPKNAEL